MHTPRLWAIALLLFSSVAWSQGGPPPLADPGGPLAMQRPPLLPQAVASFGATRSDSWLYVFGGHIGRAHKHTKDNVVGAFQRWHLVDGQSWEPLPDGPPLQGTALVAAPDGSLYRLGGLTAHNAPGENDDLHSTDSVQRFDPAVGRWEDATPLPEPRSSHDAVVIDGQLYIAGGWNLAGPDHSTFGDAAWVADLARQPLQWQSLPTPPFRRRACALAAYGHKLAVIGGMSERGPTSAVHFYDPEKRSWEAGPDLPGPGFGAAAMGVGDSLYSSGVDGRLFRLDVGAGDWNVCGQLALPRFFHRLVPSVDRAGLLAIGGAGGGDHMRTIERVPLELTAAPVVQEWIFPFPGRATRAQGVALHNDLLHVFGGRVGGARAAHDRVSQEAWRINLADFEVTALGELPAARESIVAVPGDASGERTLLLGGVGPEATPLAASAGAVVSTQPWGFTFHSRRRAQGSKIAPFEATISQPRTQFRAVEYGGRVWVFGGSAADDPNPTEVLVCDPRAEAPRFEPSGIDLPQARRAFGAAVIGTKCYLVGGVDSQGEPRTDCDVFDFETRQWTAAAVPPRTWISPQVSAIGTSLYVACGQTMQDGQAVDNSSVVAFSADSGWSTIVGELPFSTHNAHMLAHRDRLLFYSGDHASSDSAAIRLFKPRADVIVPAKSPF